MHEVLKRKLQDKDSVKELTAKIKEDLKSSNEKGFLNASLFHWHNGELDKAREYAKFVSSCCLEEK
jgi:hypothetical protein